MSRTASGVTTNYKWEVGSGLPVVLEDGTNRYVYGLDLISATNSGGAQTYFLYDGLGSTTELINGATGATTMAFRYDVIGAICWQNPTGTSPTPWLFTGEQRDSGSNFYYLRARYYDPSIGRFLSKDPLPMGNVYAYAGNNPVNFVDPSGLCPPTLCAPAAAGCTVGPVGCAVGAAVGLGVTGTVVCIGVGCGEAVVDVMSGLGSLFSKGKSGQGDKERLGSIENLGKWYQKETSYPVRGSDVENARKEACRQILEKYGRLGPKAQKDVPAILGRFGLSLEFCRDLISGTLVPGVPWRSEASKE